MKLLPEQLLLYCLALFIGLSQRNHLFLTPIGLPLLQYGIKTLHVGINNLITVQPARYRQFIQSPKTQK